MLPKRGVRVMNYRHVTFWAIVFVILCALLWLLREVLLPFVAGMGLAYVLAPVADRLERAGLNRTVATLSIVGLVILSLIAVALLILPLLAGAFTFVQSRMMMPPTRPDMTDQERSMQGITKQMSFIFPVMIFVFSFLFPQGLAIYWVTGTMFMVAQQYHLLGWNGLKVPSWFPGANRVTALTIPRTTVPVKTGAGRGTATAVVAANSGKNGSRNGAKPVADDEQVRSQSATARSLARSGSRPNRPNRRRRRR